MFENTLKSPRSALSSPESGASLALLLNEPHQENQGRFRLAATISAVFAVLAALAIFLFPAIRLIDPNNAGYWQGVNASLLFWISISQGMIVLGVLTRVAHASWRFPISRLLDMASLFGVWGVLILPFLIIVRTKLYMMGGQGMENSNNVWAMPVPILWDTVPVLTMYGIGWAMLYLTSLPDFAALATRPEADERERRFYGRLSGWITYARDEATGKRGWMRSRWIGSTTQWAVLRQAEGLLVVAGLVAFVASQTVLAWDFQLSPARGWDASIFPPLFAVGALIGGCSMCVLLMTIVNQFFPGQNLIEERHYDNIGRFMIALGLIWFYFRWCDYITNWYGHVPEEAKIQDLRTVMFPALFMVELIGCMFAPIFGNMIHRIRCSASGLCTVAVLNLTGIAVQRWLDTVPTFAPNHAMTQLTPMWADVVVFLGATGMFALSFLIGARYIPVVSWWGMAKNRQRSRLQKMGNTQVTVMMEDPAVWRN